MFDSESNVLIDLIIWLSRETSNTKTWHLLKHKLASNIYFVFSSFPHPTYWTPWQSLHHYNYLEESTSKTSAYQFVLAQHGLIRLSQPFGLTNTVHLQAGHCFQVLLPGSHSLPPDPVPDRLELTILMHF